MAGFPTPLGRLGEPINSKMLPRGYRGNTRGSARSLLSPTPDPSPSPSTSTYTPWDDANIFCTKTSPPMQAIGRGVFVCKPPTGLLPPLLFVLELLNNEEEVYQPFLMAITRNTSVRASSPTPSENSDMYYKDFHHTSPSPAPSQTADAFGWESDSSLAPMELRDATPTPLTARPPSLALVTEILRDDDQALRQDHQGEQRRREHRRHVAWQQTPAPPPNTIAPTQQATPLQLPPPPLLQRTSRYPRRYPRAAALATAPATPPIAAPAPVAVPAAAPVAAPAAAPAVAHAAAPAAAPTLPPLWLTADALPSHGSYTPTPAGGFPPIVYSPEQLLQGVPADLIQMYEEVSSPKFFLVMSGGNGAVMRTHGLIHEAIANYINIDPTTFTLGTPPTAANGSSPTLWLAADIPDPLAQGIVNARILSSTNITLYTLPYNMPIISFVGVFAGFMLPNTAMGANTAQDLIGTAVQANNEISQFVQTHRNAFGPQVSSGEAWGAFLASITVHSIVLIVNDTNTVAWRLHVTPPTNNRDSWSQLRRLFGKLQIMTALYGTARLQRAFKCHIFPSIDHPTPLCPLPDLPSWLGPTPATIAALEDASRAAASKAQEQMHLNTADGAGSSNARPGAG
ncbi:hypothetical protein DFH08DRAFT_1036314 [Mycena albidolilacea]|uniref:Uncharacterized protein n=1 Tax=Mycena albidolilacea TaxID=1033008 RepID=A0AAD7EFZ7_9AGAR|nr:hypothetical protein DFH08DRAFT_1036314 [Mycena albidolilacea]